VAFSMMCWQRALRWPDGTATGVDDASLGLRLESAPESWGLEGTGGAGREIARSPVPSAACGAGFDAAASFGEGAGAGGGTGTGAGSAAIGATGAAGGDGNGVVSVATGRAVNVTESAGRDRR